MPNLTPSQTVGPFFHAGLSWRGGEVADPDGIEIQGHVVDGNGEPVADALVETWQATVARGATDGDGLYRVKVTPAAFVDISVFARGLIDRVVTRAYLDGEAPDPTLQAVPNNGGFIFDIHLQGDAETTFFVV